MGNYFSQIEFECPCCKEASMDPSFVDRLNMAREYAGIPFRLTSAYRCTVHNALVKGRSNSRHLTGEAVDIACTDPRDRAIILGALGLAGFVSVAIAPTFIHVDTSTEQWCGIYTT
jgi:uncharacterized protein YcbK (DUF882 family)